MKTVYSFICVMVIFLLLYSCSDNKTNNIITGSSKHITQAEYSESVTLNNNSIIITRRNNSDTVTENEMPDTTIRHSDKAAVTEGVLFSEIITEHSVETSDTTYDNKSQYINYINNNSSDYLENNGEKNAYDPIYTFLDLDGDSDDELILFVQFSQANCASFYLFDNIDGNIIEILSSKYVAPYRTADKFAVFTDSNGKYFIRRTNNDGMYSHLTTVYSYNGSELIPVYSISGCYNDPSYFSVSDNGGDIFDSYDETKFRDVTEEEFSEIENKLCSTDSDVFNSSDVYIN